MTYPRALTAITLVLAVHITAVVLNLYYLYKWFDVPMHFSGGFVIGLLGLAIWHGSVRSIDVKKKIGWMIGPLFVLGFVALVSIVWEWHEFLLDQYRSVATMHQPSISDTMADFVLDLSGGVLAIVMFWKGYEKR